jgi:hypothetical protein
VRVDRGWCCLRGHALSLRVGDTGAAGHNDPSCDADRREVITTCYPGPGRARLRRRGRPAPASGSEAKRSRSRLRSRWSMGDSWCHGAHEGDRRSGARGLRGRWSVRSTGRAPERVRRRRDLWPHVPNPTGSRPHRAPGFVPCLGRWCLPRDGGRVRIGAHPDVGPSSRSRQDEHLAGPYSNASRRR